MTMMRIIWIEDWFWSNSLAEWIDRTQMDRLGRNDKWFDWIRRWISQ